MPRVFIYQEKLTRSLSFEGANIRIFQFDQEWQMMVQTIYISDLIAFFIINFAIPHEFVPKSLGLLLGGPLNIPKQIPFKNPMYEHIKLTLILINLQLLFRLVLLQSKPPQDVQELGE
jgi:hypothetical protein